MNSGTDAVFRVPPVDGMSKLPAKPGIYAMLNRVTRMINIGQSVNINRRCVLHRTQIRAGIASNLRVRRDTERYGADAWFFYALEVLNADETNNLERALNRRELWWVVQLQAHDERFGYVSEAGHCRTTGARFRDRERKLMRRRSQRYELLPGVSLCDGINSDLLMSWSAGN